MVGHNRTALMGSCLAIGCLLAPGRARTNPATGYPAAQPYAGPTQPYGGGPAWSGAPGSVQTAPPQAQPPANMAVPGAPPAGYPGAQPAAVRVPRLQRPKWSDPGTISEQQQQAEKFDPYGSIDAGPVIEGGRPRDFQYPTPAPARSNKFRGNF